MIVCFRITVALLAFGFVLSPARGQEKVKFYVGASSKTLGYSPLWVGLKKGFFDQQGLDAQLLLLRGTTMPNVAKFIEQSYLHEALKELNRR